MPLSPKEDTIFVLWAVSKLVFCSGDRYPLPSKTVLFTDIPKQKQSVPLLAICAESEELYGELSSNRDKIIFLPYGCNFLPFFPAASFEFTLALDPSRFPSPISKEIQPDKFLPELKVQFKAFLVPMSEKNF